jgi:hypothetical protein
MPLKSPHGRECNVGEMLEGVAARHDAAPRE